MTDTEVDRRLEAAKVGMTNAYWADVQPDNVAIISTHGNRTFAELNGRTNQLVRALRARGLGAGDSVALMCANRPEFVETVHACQRAGLRMTPHLTGDEAGYILDDCEAKAFVADARFPDCALAAAEMAPNAKVRLSVGGLIDGFDSYEATIADESTDDIDDPTLGNSMLYTSGTTGRPKGVHRPPTPVAAASALTARFAKYTPGEDLHLCTGPLYHAAPLAFSLAAPLAYGVGTVLMDGWDAEDTLRYIETYKITHTHMVPTMFHRLISLPQAVKERYDVSSLRFVLHGAAPCPVPVKQRLIEWWGPIVVEYYAATEGWGTLVGSEEWLKRPGTVGKPATPDHVKIVGDDGEEVGPNTTGTIYLKAAEASAFKYFKDDDKTASAYRGEWFTLGDVGYLDDDGYLYLTDRTANLIISGGVNIYPAEVDAVLLTHPAVGDVATIGVPNEEWGEEVKAVVEPQPGLTATPELAEELIAFCRERLAAYKCPRTVDFVDELPRQDNGKIYKRLLRDRYRSSNG
jgi:long-chain acyl-CoA synthetase